MPRTTTTELRVRYAETDQMHVAYHAHYLVWCEMGRTEFIRQLGMSYAEMEAAGVMLAVAEATVRYQQSARYDDRVIVTTSLAEVRSRQVTFDYVLTRGDDGAALATARTSLVTLHRTTGKLTSFPEAMRRQLEAGCV